MNKEDQELNNERNHVRMSMIWWLIVVGGFLLVLFAALTSDAFAQVVVTRPPVACTTVCDQIGLCTTICN